MFLVFCSDADGCPLRSGDRKADGFLQHFLLIYVRVKCLLAYIILQATTVHVCYLDLSRILHDLIFRDTSQSLCRHAITNPRNEKAALASGLSDGANPTG
jgi:hypothetical protein